MIALIPAQYRVLAGGVVLAILLGLAVAATGWQVAGHYRPLLDAAQDELATCRASRDNLQTLVGEQGRKLGDLVKAGQQRQETAVVAVAKARTESAPDYAAANRIQQVRIGGDQCAAATTVIDQELGL